ncbi:hypothetical protein BBD42_29650 [Paenibacillus sp. BIHB 4019]|uniref:HAMP domain-containing protein n=1 Tax=Paenibacillus sp. BIHB 4019 TaxID=1870819 RepID=A0A1B2DR80_9BACL|nr:histidine kinase [Paenibacillus sp. BIHB 4019]ANY70207.1 hypothetical protein BBD42_29650 [Paenibacillus sp. BIHB 4019]
MRTTKLLLNSLRFKLFATILLIIIPLITILILNSYYSMRVVRNQVTQSNKNMLGLYMGQIDRNLEEIDKFLFNLSETDGDVLTLTYPRMRDEDAYLLAKLGLFQTLIGEKTYYPSADLFFAYSEPNEELIMTQDFGNSTEEREKVRHELLTMILKQAGTLDYSKWHVWQGEDGNYLFHIIKTGEVYVGAWINSNKLMVPLKLMQMGEAGISLFTTTQNKPLSNAAFIQENAINLQFPTQSYSKTGHDSHFLVMGEPSNQGNFNLVTVIPERSILEHLPFLQRISNVVSIVAGLFLLLFFLLMRRIFLEPFKKIIVAMRKLKDGNWNVQLDQKPTSTEFEMLNQTFARMIKEIHSLKIDVYEEKLNHQKAELKHLQLQINPHFFLNSLNIIYNLATVKDYLLIQEMAKCLVIYFRYMFRSNSYYVSLKDEFDHTANYLRIQQMRFPNSLSYQVQEVPDALRSIEIPPLIVQTMVENTIKHAVDMDKSINIQVKLKECDEKGRKYLVLTIQDSGPGFPEDMLELLKREAWSSGESEQLGIWNVQRRLRLLYQEEACLRLFNHPDGGAVVELWLPKRAA